MRYITSEEVILSKILRKGGDKGEYLGKLRKEGEDEFSTENSYEVCNLKLISVM